MEIDLQFHNDVKTTIRIILDALLVVAIHAVTLASRSSYSRKSPNTAT